jgi:putative hydrolase of the HAD superfamily
LPPEWTELSVLRSISGIKAVLFDVYGTLFSSAAGDISFSTFSVATDTACKSDEALEAIAVQYGISAKDMRSFFIEQVKAMHLSLSEKTIKISWPEVRVDEIWAEFLWKHGKTDYSSFCNDEQARELEARALALRYELAVNPVYPMPGALETIDALKEKGLILGIVSNAQFFTPLLFDAFFHKTPEELGFNPALLFWSFEHGEAKPSPVLFGAAVNKLEEMGIKPNECVFVGNDMLSDIYGAASCGFKTILFAGDSRSFRMRENDERARNIKPDRVIRSLGELKNII